MALKPAQFSLHTTLPEPITTLLFASWVLRYATEDLGLEQLSTGSTAEQAQIFTFGNPESKHFVLERSPTGKWHVRVSEGLDEVEVSQLLKHARKRVKAHDVGDKAVIYRTTLEARDSDEMPVWLGPHFMRLLGDQRHIAGKARLSDVVVLDFKSKQRTTDPSTLQLFAPDLEIEATIFAPGPVAGPLTDQVARAVLALTSATCTFALGRTVTMPPMIFPLSDQEQETQAQAARHDQQIHNLARNGVSVDIFGDFGLLGGVGGITRIGKSLLAYQAALEAKNAEVATILLVTSIEALVVPPQEWRKTKATQRFIQAMMELYPEGVDAAVSHRNAEDAFDYRQRGGKVQRRRQLLDQIYALRSDPAHNGLGVPAVGPAAHSDPGAMRIAILSDLAQGAILKFLQAPRSWLIGHPTLDVMPADTTPA